MSLTVNVWKSDDGVNWGVGGGPPGSLNLLYNQQFVGAVNGTNRIFTLLWPPANGIALYRSGWRMNPALDYILLGSSIQLSFPLMIGERLAASYALSVTGATLTPVYSEIATGAINGTNKVFTSAHNFASGPAVTRTSVELDLSAGDFSVTGANQVTLAVAPKTGEWVLLDYAY